MSLRAQNFLSLEHCVDLFNHQAVEKLAHMNRKDRRLLSGRFNSLLLRQRARWLSPSALVPLLWFINVPNKIFNSIQSSIQFLLFPLGELVRIDSLQVRQSILCPSHMIHFRLVSHVGESKVQQ